VPWSPSRYPVISANRARQWCCALIVSLRINWSAWRRSPPFGGMPPCCASTSRHRVTAVTRGQRLASVFWIQSLIRDDAQRAQLFELDGTIQRLTSTGADSDSLVRLTAHYHGLLRAWTEI